MKKKVKFTTIVINSLLCLIQSIVLAFIPKEREFVIIYIIFAIFFTIGINVVPYFVSKTVEIDATGVFTTQTFHENFIPYVIRISTLPDELETINKIHLLYEWRKAVRKAEIYSDVLKFKNGETLSYDENFIYLNEWNCIIDSLIEVYDKNNKFSDLFEVYKCKQMSHDTNNYYAKLKAIRKK